MSSCPCWLIASAVLPLWNSHMAVMWYTLPTSQSFTVESRNAMPRSGCPVISNTWLMVCVDHASCLFISSACNTHTVNPRSTHDQQIFIISHGKFICHSYWAPFVVEARIELVPFSRGGNNHSPTRQMQVEFGIASHFFNLLASLASVFFLLSVSLFTPLIESYSSPIPKYKHTPDTLIYLLLWHTHSHDGLFFE
jgi:hypothetical protein